MFNFNLQNRAFEELNAEQFRMIYFLNNTLSMVNEKHNTPDNDKLEMFNGYMMDKLGLGIRMIQYHVKELEKLGYITVERPIGRNAAKKPNIITINVAGNNAINCALYEKETTNSTENNAINDAINDAINCTLNKKEIRRNNNIYTSTCSNSTCMKKDNIKEKIYKKEVDYRDNGSMGISPSDERDESFLEFYNSLDDGDDWDESQMEEVNKNIKENEMSDNGASVMNAKSEMKWNVKQGSNNVAECVKGTITSTYGDKVNTSTVVNENRPTSTESMKIYTATAAQTETENKRASLLKNIEDGKKFMYEASKMKDLNGWKMQMEYITMQFDNLKKITSPEAYKSVRTDFKRWWDATKQFFPTDYEKHIAKKEQKQHPKRNLEKNIKPIDVRILQYWIDERENANAQEQKDNAQNMIDTVLSGWYDKYETDAIVQICQEYHLEASGENQTAKVEQLPTEDKTMQYKPLEEECGDFVNDNLKIYCINKPSAQVAN